MPIISEVTAQVLKSYEYPHGGWVLVRVRTETGIEGVGECFVSDRFGRGVFAAKELIEGRLAQEAVGQEVLAIQVIWERLYDACRRLYDRRGMMIHALSGIDMAVHDAAARSVNVRLCDFLGGCFRERVKVYVSSIWVDGEAPSLAYADVEAYVEQGYTALKFHGWPGFGSQPQRDVGILSQLRAKAGDGVDLMLDLGRPASLAEAIEMARMIEHSGADIYWWEEPLSSTDDAVNMAELTARTDVRIAAGEADLTAYAFRDLISRRVVDLLQPDLSWVGGITEGRRIAEMARLANIPLVPHNWGTAINTAASVHLVAAMPQGFLCEYPITRREWGEVTLDIPSPMMTALASTPVLIEDGYAVVPPGPGLGIELDEDAVARYTLDA
jgi:L-rhamnonate dehydratase